VLVTEVGEFAGTFTNNCSVGNELPPLIACVDAQLAVPVPAPEHDHPAPAELDSVYPNGNVSETLTVPLVVLPLCVLLTLMSHSAVEPCVKVPLCVLETDRFGATTLMVTLTSWLSTVAVPLPAPVVAPALNVAVPCPLVSEELAPLMVPRSRRTTPECHLER